MIRGVTICRKAASRNRERYSSSWDAIDPEVRHDLIVLDGELERLTSFRRHTHRFIFCTSIFFNIQGADDANAIEDFGLLGGACMELRLSSTSIEMPHPRLRINLLQTER